MRGEVRVKGAGGQEQFAVSLKTESRAPTWHLGPPIEALQAQVPSVRRWTACFTRLHRLRPKL